MKELTKNYLYLVIAMVLMAIGIIGLILIIGKPTFIDIEGNILLNMTEVLRGN